MTTWNPPPRLAPPQRYVVHVARATVEAHQAYGTEAVARWNAPPAGTATVADTANLPGALMFAYDLAIRQIAQLLAIIDALTGSAEHSQSGDSTQARERAYIERQVIQAALAGSQTREDVPRTVAAAQREWRSAASDEDRSALMRAAEEAVNPGRGAS